MNRSQKILSKVYRNLKLHGIDLNNLTDQEIYDEMKSAQDIIIAETVTDKEIEITLQNGIDTYNLTAGSIEGEITNLNISSVKIIETPNSWGNSYVSDYGNKEYIKNGFDIIPNLKFFEYVNSNKGQTGRPRIGTIIDNKLKVYPTPDNETNGDTIKLYVYLSSSSSTINEQIEPELKNVFDKAIELYATAQFLSGKERMQFLSEFYDNLRLLKPINNKKQHNLARASIVDW